MCAFYPIYLQPEDVPSEIFEEDFPVMPWRTYDSYEENCDEDFLEPMMNKAGCSWLVVKHASTQHKARFLRIPISSPEGW
jgi:hypothetical protein